MSKKLGDLLPTFEDFVRRNIEKKLDEGKNKTSKNFDKAVNNYRNALVDLQNVQKEFVKTPKSDTKTREELKAKIVELHKKSKAAEKEFQSALSQEPVDFE